jgi:hypothetical protein
MASRRFFSLTMVVLGHQRGRTGGILYLLALIEPV